MEKKRPLLASLKKAAKYTVLGVGVATTSTFLYASALLGIEVYASVNSPRLCNGEARPDSKKCREDVEPIFLEEKAKLEVLEKKINLVFMPNGTISSSAKLKDDHYLIRLGMDSTLVDLKHELYHIADGHCDMEFDNSYSFMSSVRQKHSVTLSPEIECR